MSRIVITSWGSYGDVNPYLALGAALRARAHHVVLCMPQYYESVIRAAGLDFQAGAPDADPDLDRDLVRRVTHPRHGAEVIFRDVLAPFLADSHAALTRAVHGADLLVSHPAALTAPIVAQQTGVRWISSILSPLNFMSRHEPVLPPMAPWLRHLPWPLLQWSAPWLASGGRSVGARWVEPVQRFRNSLGLARGANPLFEGQHAPQGVLALFSRMLGTPFPDWPPNVTVTGQLRYDKQYGATLTSEVQQFLRDGPAPAVFTLGSALVEVGDRFWDESLGAVQKLGARAVLLAGRHYTARLRAIAPPNALVVESAPHSLLFPFASVVVHPCGVGTTGTALASGRPQLAVPHANDQPDNAWRLTRLGVARALYPGRYRAGRVAREISTLLATPSYAKRAGEVADVVAHEPGAGAACGVIERALAAPCRNDSWL